MKINLKYFLSKRRMTIEKYIVKNNIRSRAELVGNLEGAGVRVSDDQFIAHVDQEFIDSIERKPAARPQSPPVVRKKLAPSIRPGKKENMLPVQEESRGTKKRRSRRSRGKKVEE